MRKDTSYKNSAKPLTKKNAAKNVYKNGIAEENERFFSADSERFASFPSAPDSELHVVNEVEVDSIKSKMNVKNDKSKLFRNKNNVDVIIVAGADNEDVNGEYRKAFQHADDNRYFTYKKKDKRSGKIQFIYFAYLGNLKDNGIGHWKIGNHSKTWYETDLRKSNNCGKYPPADGWKKSCAEGCSRIGLDFGVPTLQLGEHAAYTGKCLQSEGEQQNILN